MRKALPLIALLLCVSFAAAQECPSADSLLRDKLEAMQLFLNYRGQIQLTVMDAIIEKLADPALQSLRDQFALDLDHLKEALEYRDPQILTEGQEELETIILKFRGQIGQREDLKELRQYARTKLDTEDEHLMAFRNQAFLARKTLYLHEFDRTSCVYRTVITGLNEEDYNQVRLLNRLKLLGNFRPKLEAAINDAHQHCRSVPLFKCGNDADDLSTLERIIQEGFTNLRDDIVNRGIADRTTQNLDVMRADIETLAEAINASNATEHAEWQTEVAELTDSLAEAQRDLEDKAYDLVERRIDILRGKYERLQAEVRL